ncbi:HD domain-containing protein [Clostridium swellfunianum]|uniref:HD-GYP domain-containing protein n=1 Tax=Clostridium swellfunianum TaxID=1367462 RepID=UPI00202ECFE2|nr:HD domain-containing phosphohydrolase [Clostridium swellfunianum]MCM0649336.1 HD domain-containing protein [Clostridium swellfunianum]
MKHQNQKSIAELYKQHIKLIISIIAAVMMSIFILLFLNLSKTNNNNNLINTLGKQRMLTQMMAKDVGRIYELTTITNGQVLYEIDKDELKSRTIKTIDELSLSMNEYDKQLSNIKKGYVEADGKGIRFKGNFNELNKIIDEQEKVWTSFKEAINKVIKEQNNSTEFLDAVKYINENNEVLLNYSNQVTENVLSYNNKRATIIYYLFMILPLLMLIFLAVFIKRAYKSLFIPISQLSKGVSTLGIKVEQEPLMTAAGQESLPAFSEVTMLFDQLNSLILFIENLNRNIPFKDVLNYIFKDFSKYIPYTYIGVALIDDDKKNITAAYAACDKFHTNLPQKLLGKTVTLKNTSLEKIVETGEERIINDLEEYIKDKPFKEYNRILLEEGVRASITFPLRKNDEVIGIIFFSSNTKNVYRKEHVRFLKTLANSIVLALEKDILMEDMIISSTMALAKLTEERDNETGEHLQRMKIYSRMLAQFLAEEEKYKDFIDIDYINDIERFAPLHDIGKVGIRDEILLKPGKLTEEEFEIMKTHASYGAKVLRMAENNLNKKGRSIYRLAIEIAEGHHEKWDGSGYPYGKKGEAIPVSARIVAMADVFDALTSERPYKKPFSFEDSVKIITDGKGKHFDPELVNVFMRNIHKIKQKYIEFNSKPLL